VLIHHDVHCPCLKVDWYEWGEEAFEKARREDKPIFLSVDESPHLHCFAHSMPAESAAGWRRPGAINLRFRVDCKCRDLYLYLLLVLPARYSVCHWCHVMERESFESEEVAQLMNANFVNVKVDREERPDVDKVGRFSQLQSAALSPVGCSCNLRKARSMGVNGPSR
jgi:uncharacterized protein YyaL (SSP411 family)